MVHCIPMVTHVAHSTPHPPVALRTVVYVVVIGVFAVLNPLACVWHCALHNQLAERAAHNQHHAQMHAAHGHDPASTVIADNGDTTHVRGGAPIVAVHDGVIYTLISLVLALLGVVLNSTLVLLRRPCATLVPFPPPPKHFPRYA